MATLTLPSTDLAVSPICLGTADMGSTIPRERAFDLFDLFVELGGNFLDSANVYANWLPGERCISEKTIGAWMKERGNRDRMVIATKGAHPDLKTMHVPRLSPREIVSDIDESLRNLGTDRIDLYYLHRDDPSRPVEDVMTTLNNQIKAGKVRYIGCSNWKAARIHDAMHFSLRNNLQSFRADQMQWNAAVPDPAHFFDPTMVAMSPELYQLHGETGLAAIPYSSQAGGIFNKMAKEPQKYLDTGWPGTYNNPENGRRLHRMLTVCAEKSITVTQAVLGFLLSQPFTTVPIVGCKSPQQLRDSMGAMDVRLTAEELSAITGGASF